MRKVFIIAFLLFAGSSLTVNAQALKFGHIDISKLIEVMPERNKAKAELDKTAEELESVLVTLQNEFQTMIQEYTSKRETMSELIRKAKEDDMQIKQQRIESFSAQARQQLQQKEQDLMVPIYSKADSVIATVAKEQGLIYVFDVRVVLYQSPQSLDVLPLVKKKMGIE